MVKTLQPGSPPDRLITVSQMLASRVSGRAAPLLLIFPALERNQTSLASELCPLAATLAMDFSIVSGVVGSAGFAVTRRMPLFRVTMQESPPDVALVMK